MTDFLSSMRRFFGELKRRRVLRVGAVYAVTAFVVLQAADILFPALRLPEWSMSLVVALILLGFPVAVALAWAFDMTPEGLVRTPPMAPSGRSPSPQRALAFVLGIVVALSGAWFGANRLGDRSLDLEVDESVVAVLPFRVGGADPTIAYLREGMVDLLEAALLSREAGEPEHRLAGLTATSLPALRAYRFANMVVILPGYIAYDVTQLRIRARLATLLATAGEPLTGVLLS